MRWFFIVFLTLLSHSVLALELFGVTVNNINREQLREAIRNTGAEVIREAGDDNWYDIYNMAVNFKQSKQLLVGYEKINGNLAFIEYHLPYQNLSSMLKRLQLKYGKETQEYGRFESDTRFVWNVDGIRIELSQNWEKNIGQLIYSQPASLEILQSSYQQAENEKLALQLNAESIYY